MGTVTQSKPDWLTIQIDLKDKFSDVKQTLRDINAVTVCEESHCPNLSECWNSGTATFMVLGDTCTRGCRFCNVKTSLKGNIVDKSEPDKLVKAVKNWKLNYIVLTSVDRDDLPDQGAGHFAECIKKLKQEGILVEVLIPDFQGNIDHLQTIIDAKPDVIAHNIETVERLQRTIRDRRANYKQSLSVLDNVKKLNSDILTKSSIMLGFGETKEEVEQSMQDLRSKEVDIVTLGQYLRPSKRHIELQEYIEPNMFTYYKDYALKLGFKYAASGPFVRSSYMAGDLFIKNILRGESTCLS